MGSLALHELGSSLTPTSQGRGARKARCYLSRDRLGARPWLYPRPPDSGHHKAGVQESMARKWGAEGFSTKAAGGSVPLGLVAAALFLVLFV